MAGSTQADPEQLPSTLGSGLWSPVELLSGSRSPARRTAVTTFISSSQRCRFIRVCQRISAEADDLVQLMGRREAGLYRCVLSTVRKAKHCSLQDDLSLLLHAWCNVYVNRCQKAFTFAHQKHLVMSLLGDFCFFFQTSANTNVIMWRKWWANRMSLSLSDTAPLLVSAGARGVVCKDKYCCHIYI